MVSLSECAKRLYVAELLTDKEFKRIKIDLEKRGGEDVTATKHMFRYFTSITPIHIFGVGVLATIMMMARHEFDVRTDISRLMNLLLSTSNVIALSPHLAAFLMTVYSPGAKAQEQYSAWVAVGLLWGLCAQVLSMLSTSSDVEGQGGYCHVVVMVVQAVCLSIAFSAPIVARSSGVVVSLPPLKLVTLGVPVYLSSSLLLGAVLSCEDNVNSSLATADLCGDDLHSPVTRPPALALLLVLAASTMVWRAFARIRFSVESITVRRYLCQCFGFLSSLALATARVLWLLGRDDAMLTRYEFEMCGIAALCVSNLVLKPQPEI